VKFVNFAAPAGGSHEIWKALIASDALKKLFAVPSLELRKSTTLPDGKNRPDGHRDRDPRPRGRMAGAFRERLLRAAG